MSHCAHELVCDLARLDAPSAVATLHHDVIVRSITDDHAICCWMNEGKIPTQVYIISSTQKSPPESIQNPPNYTLLLALLWMACQ